ncbi:EamA-like transporter family protein [uncultured archaeon]|nr:EamA-like transporter family protein [uncultured archaeon]
MIYIPLIGAVASAAGTVLEKAILKKKKMGIKLYQIAGFLAIVLVLIPLLFFFWKLDAGAFSTKSILIFAGIVISATIANFLVFYSEKAEKITSLEPIKILEPMFVILLAVILSFFIEGIGKSNIKIIIPAVIASIALIFPHIKKNHIKFNKYFIAAIFGSFFFAFELVLSKLILDFYSPITFYFFRCLFILALSLMLFKPGFKSLDKKSSLMILAMGVISVIFRVATYFGYMQYGIVFTTLIIMISPIFVYIFANKFLKEKLNWKNIISSLIIVACVVYALFA